MKKQILGLLIIILFANCSNKRTKCIIITPTVITDTIEINNINCKNTIFINKEEKKLIDSFRPVMKDVAYYMLLNKESFNIDKYRFCCDEYKFWIANNYYAFGLDEPIEVELSQKEKQYFWNIYIEYRNNKLRLFNWEPEIKIVTKK